MLDNYLKDLTVDLPEWKRPEEQLRPESFALWSGDDVKHFDPPQLGTYVRITLNGWNAAGSRNDVGDILAYVMGYQVVQGWLMVWVRPDNRPVWHLRDDPNRHVVLMSGSELEAVK